jgi:hypothetical protein
MKSPRIYVVFLLALIVFSFLIRLIGWDDPYFGFHIGRKISTLQSIESYARDGVDFLNLKVNLLPGWQEYPLLELPIYQALSAWSSTFTKTVLSASRSVNLCFALLTLLVVFQIAVTQFCRKTAIYAVLFFAFAPLNLMYQSATLPDISSVFFMSLAYWLLAKYLKGTQSKILVFIFLLAGSYSVLVKPNHFLPVGLLFVTHFLQQWGYPRVKNFSNYVVQHRAIIGSLALITVLMLFWWGVVIPRLAPVSPSIVNYNFLSLSHLYSVAFYARVLYRWFLLLLNPITLSFFLLGILLLFRDHRRDERMALIYSIIGYYLIFGGVISGHEYYALAMVPFASVIAGRGAVWVEEKVFSDFKIRSEYVISATMILSSAICSVFIFSVNFIAALDLEQRSLPIEKEMRGVLKKDQYSYVYVNQLNFPIGFHVVYDRTSKLKYFTGLLSKEQVRLRSQPLRSEAIISRLETHGSVEMVASGLAPEVDVEKLQMKYQGHMRYLIFHRFTNKTKAQIKNKIKSYQLIYESVDWLVFDLASG